MELIFLSYSEYLSFSFSLSSKPKKASVDLFSVSGAFLLEIVFNTMSLLET